MTSGDLVTKARSNWRSAVWVVVAVLAAGMGIIASVVVRAGVAPGAGEQTARDFVDAWNRSDFQQVYSYLNTPVSQNDFVSALSGSATPIRDARVERVDRQDDREAVVEYSASVPEAMAAVAGVVVANRQRYAQSCVDVNARGARYVRVTDTLIADKGATGTWKINFRRDPGAPDGAAVLGLAYDLSPGIFYRAVSGADEKSPTFDDQVIADAYSIYQRDVGTLPTEDPTQASADTIRLQVRVVASTCGTGG